MPILQIVIFELFIVFLMFLILQQERKNLLKVKSIKKVFSKFTKRRGHRIRWKQSVKKLFPFSGRIKNDKICTKGHIKLNF